MKEQILNDIAEKVMVNLAKHNVELSTVQTIIDYAIKANKIVSDIDKLESEFTTSEKRILDLRKQFNSYKENAKKDMPRIQAKRNAYDANIAGQKSKK